MDHVDATTLLACLQAVPHRRPKKGQSYDWRYLLVLIAAALASGRKNMAAIAEWVHQHEVELPAVLNPAKRRLSSFAAAVTDG
jgi:hypothetical protein